MKKLMLFNATLFFCTMTLLNVLTEAQAIPIPPTVGFTSRNGIGIVDARPGPINILCVKEGIEDRTILEFDITSESISTSPIYLNFYMRNIDRPNFSTLSLYGFVGNGLVDVNDFNRTDNFITSFTDNGTMLPNSILEYDPFSLDVTNIFNNFISSDNSFLSFLLLADTTNARYDLNAGSPIFNQGISLSNQLLAPLNMFIDIKPKNCPNPLKVTCNGALPVAILGTVDLDVRDIDIATLEIEGVAPHRTAFKDVATPTGSNQPCICLVLGRDGTEDLVLKFRTQEIVANLPAVQNGDVIPLMLTGMLQDGTPIGGIDCVVIKGVK